MDNKSHSGRWARNWKRGVRPETTNFLIPIREGQLSERANWVRIDLPTTAQAFARLSPGGQMLYYADSADGNLCLWAQRLDGRTRHPLGKGFPVLHFHSRNQVFLGERWAVDTNRILLNLNNRGGNIWMIDEIIPAGN